MADNYDKLGAGKQKSDDAVESAIKYMVKASEPEGIGQWFLNWCLIPIGCGALGLFCAATYETSLKVLRHYFGKSLADLIGDKNLAASLGHPLPESPIITPGEAKDLR